jgi:nitroreductase
MSLAAADMGLAAVWITGYREPSVQAVLGIPSDVPVVAMLAIGYPDGFGSLPDRLPDRDVIAWEQWGKEPNW